MEAMRLQLQSNQPTLAQRLLTVVSLLLGTFKFFVIDFHCEIDWIQKNEDELEKRW